MTGEAPSPEVTGLSAADQLAVMGSPIAHSLSPLIHSTAYAELGLPWRYGAEDVQARDLAAALDARGPEWRGFSLTMPLKEEAHRLARVLDPVATESGVANTLLRLSGDAGWAGFNTDVPGLASAIAAEGLDASETIVIGSGATAVSAILAARRLGALRVRLVARNMQAAGDLVARFGKSREPGSDARLWMDATTLRESEALLADPSLGGATLVISTLPGPAGEQLELPGFLTEIPLFDVAYDPWPSPLAHHWRKAGGEAYSGHAMLVEQAIIQIRIFLNGDPAFPLPAEDAVRAAMQRGIAKLDAKQMRLD